MYYFCPSGEGWGPLSHERPVDLTICFQYGALATVFSTMFIVATAVRIYFLRGALSLPPSLVCGRPLWTKLLLTAGVLLMSTVEVVAIVHQYSLVCNYTVALILQTVAIASALYLHYKEQLKSRISSTLLIFFWLGSALIWLMRLRTNVVLGYIMSYPVLVTINALSLLIALLLFSLEIQPKPDQLYDNVDTCDAEDGGDLFYSPEERANIFSRFSFSWMTPLLEKGLHKPLELEDTFEISDKFRPELAVSAFQRSWKSELMKETPSLFKATFCMCRWPWALSVTYKLAKDMVSLLNPILLSRLVGFIMTYGTPQAEPIENGYFYAVAIYAVVCADTYFFQSCLANNQYVESLVKSSYNSAIYQKSMALSNNSREKHDIGSIVSHITLDAQRITLFITQHSPMLIGIPIRVTLIMHMLFRTIGWSSIAGVVVMIISIPISTNVSKRMNVFDKQQIKHRDTRIKILNETLSGIKVIKLYAWDMSFIDRIRKVRNILEFSALQQYGILQALLLFISTFVPFLVAFSTFALYVLADNKSRGPLTSQLVFVALMLFNMLKDPLSGVATIVPILQNATVSYRRLQKFMIADEIDIASVDRIPYDRTMDTTSPNDELINITNGTFKWLPADQPTLENISIKCKRSELVAVIGQVGCGKSSLVSAILGDMIKQSGNAMVCGSIAYVSQRPWILNATLRDNILFGSCYEESFYNQVIDACALRPDIEVLSSGDMTEIGEKGINLSGGQNMRVSLARAVYARADLYILDNPLAAVDAHVSKHIFTKVLGPQGLLQLRARVLVTNAVQYVDSVDNIVLLSKGKILEQMSFAQAMATQGAIYEFIHRYIGNSEFSKITVHSSNVTTESCSKLDSASIGYAKPAVINRLTRKRNRSALLTESDSLVGRTTTDEVSQKGKVRMGVYSSYAKACGLQNVAMFFIVLLLASTASIGSNIWLKHWASVNDKANRVEASMQPVAKYGTYYLIVYGVLGLTHTLMNSLKSFVLWTRCSIRASSEIHNSMLTSVMGSPVSFFDTTPIGRVINRFSSDLARLDDMLPRSVFDITNTFTKIAAAAIIIAYTTPLILLLVPPLVLFYRKDQQRFLYSSRELRRLESTTRSPIIAHILESINGMSTIRAYGQQSRFLVENENRLALNIRANYNLLFTNRWLAMRLDAVGNLIVFGTSVLLVTSAHWFGKGDAALVGLAVSYAVELTHSVNMSIRFYTNMENSMTHVERATEYAQLPSEAVTVIDDHRPKQAWPEQGALEFNNYSTRYREGLDLVLRGLSFRVLPRHKVGIVGRTGAGKSSLTLALFRIIEAASGQILLDGEDISKYGLFDVRSKLSIIPQDPMLFAGTVRDNLDPFNSYSDQDIWRALEQAHLADYIRTKQESLEFMVAQSGENFSVGQRQLICLARALLKHAKVLVLDEATAAIDNETDEIIQQTIKKEFKDCTVLTIAHRLNTIIDSDMILVVDGGRLAEYDTPQNLLANKESIFAKLVEEAQNGSI